MRSLPISYLFVSSEDAEVVSELVVQQQLRRLREVDPFGLQGRDPPVEPVLLEKGLRQKDVPDGN